MAGWPGKWGSQAMAELWQKRGMKSRKAMKKSRTTMGGKKPHFSDNCSSENYGMALGYTEK